MSQLSEIKDKFVLLKSKLNYPSLVDQFNQLQQDSQKPNIWDNPESAQKTLQLLSDTQKKIQTIDSIESDISSLQEFIDFAATKPDPELEAEISNSLQKLEEQIGQLELQTYLSGKYDANFALLSIHSGQGGTEAMDWASMLQRMYMRFFERKNWKFDLIDLTPGEEAGIKSVYFKINQPFAFGYLKKESGVHRLVRLSPFNADNLRQPLLPKLKSLPLSTPIPIPISKFPPKKSSSLLIALAVTAASLSTPLIQQ